MKRFFSQSIYNAKCVELRKGKENHHFLLHNSLQKKLHDDVIDVPCESFFFLTRISSRSLRKFTKFSSLTFLPSLAQINNNIFVGASITSCFMLCSSLISIPLWHENSQIFHTQGNNCVSPLKKWNFTADELELWIHYCCKSIVQIRICMITTAAASRKRFVDCKQSPRDSRCDACGICWTFFNL